MASAQQQEDSTEQQQQQTFTQRMLRHSRQQHRRGGVNTMSKLIAALSSKQLYGTAVGSFLPVYATLEELLQSCSAHPGFKQVAAAMPQPSRAAALRRDLQFLLGPDWQEQLVEGEAVERYRQHLRQLAQHAPHRLLAYYYTLWIFIMGGGGQRMRGVVKTALRLNDDDGTHFFSFSGDTEGNRQALRDVVNSFPKMFSADECDEIVDEHGKVFEFNNDVIDSFPIPAYRVRWAVMSVMMKVVPYRVWYGAAAAVAAACLLAYVGTRRPHSFNFSS